MVQEVDVLICGSGSAGLSTATWLARYGLRCKILEKRASAMEVGQADGVQCRTVEVFDSWGIAEELLRESYHVLEVNFWASDGAGSIVRTGRTPDTTPGLSHQPHVILNQARISGLMLEAMRRFNGQEVDYGYDIKSVQVDSAAAADPEAYPVTVTAEKDGTEEIFKAKYALGSDGAHSTVRRSLGYKMIGDSTNAVYGVMDIYPRTNFPDIRKKVTIQSDYGVLMIIPREGGSLVRFYIELGHSVSPKDVKREDLQEAARKIFHPYKLEIADTVWWSAYSVGQRVVDHFSKDNRVFLMGDACHTHSPKAGQGMNTSLQDGYNMGWKLAAVLKGQVSPKVLETYNIERRETAKNLIDFDRAFARMFSSAYRVSPQHFAEQFEKAGRFTAGLTTAYSDSSITSFQRSTQILAKNLTVGMRFPSTQVVRFCDARAMHLVKALPADGRWRIVIFAGDIRDTTAAGRLEKLGSYLTSSSGPVRTFTPSSADIDSFIESIVVLSGERVKIEQEQIPEYFCPVTGKYQMRDLHKIFIDDESYNSGHGHAYEFYGVNEKKGAVALVRPDQYVSMVTAVDDHDAIGEFFKGFALSQHSVQQNGSIRVVA